MKWCSQCHKTYSDESLNFCLSDGTALIYYSNSDDETLIRQSPFTQPAERSKQQAIKPFFSYIAIALLALIAGGGIVLLLTQNKEYSAILSSKTEISTPLTNQNRSFENAPSDQMTVSQNTANANNSESQITFENQPTSDYAAKNVRAGIADGKRLRVVVDLTRTNLNKVGPARFETLASGGASGDVRIFVYAQSYNSLGVKYESKRTRKLGTVFLSPSNQGLEIKVIPQNRLYLRDVFFIPRGSTNSNDRLVIDLCTEETCPSLRPSK